MTLSEKKDLYRSKFDPILAERMCEQMHISEILDKKIHAKAHWALVLSFGSFLDSKEGPAFWMGIVLLYKQHDPELPTTSQIQEVFKRHGIEYNVG